MAKAQNSSDKSAAKQAELNKIQRQIEQSKQQLQNLARKETNQARALGTFRKQKQTIERRLDRLGEQKSALESTITLLRRTDSNLSVAMQTTRENFGRYLRYSYVSSYCAGGNCDDINKAYSDAILSRTKRNLQMMSAKHDSLALKHNKAMTENAATKALMERNASEGKTLESSIQKTQTTLGEIRADKETTLRELSEKQRSAQKINAMIAKLVEEERKREEAEKLAKHKNKDQKNKILSAKALAVAKFRWPIASRSILRNFGQYSNKQTNTVMDNPGIDVAASIGTGVAAAASGKVSLVHWLPGFNSLVIIDHGNGFRTVYANLEKTLAIKGQIVSAGAIIGRTGESVDGKFLHFEIWRGAERVNPINMLK